MRICSGRCAAAAATSAWSPRSSSRCTRSARWCTSRCSSTRPTRAASCCGSPASSSRNLPDDCGVFLAGLNAPPAPFVPEQHHCTPVLRVRAWSACGDARARRADRADPRRPWRRCSSWSRRSRTPRCSRCSTGRRPWGILAYEKAVYLDELTDGAIEVIVEHAAEEGLAAVVRADLRPRRRLQPGGRGRDRLRRAGAARYVVNIAAHAPTPELLRGRPRLGARASGPRCVPHARRHRQLRQLHDRVRGRPRPRRLRRRQVRTPRRSSRPPTTPTTSSTSTPTFGQRCGKPDTAENDRSAVAIGRPVQIPTGPPTPDGPHQLPPRPGSRVASAGRRIAAARHQDTPDLPLAADPLEIEWPQDD